MKKIIYLVTLTAFTLLACENDSEADLIDDVPIVQDDEKITYDDNVKVIIDNNCLNCHNNPPENGANTALNTFDGVVSGVNSNNLIQRISRQPGEGGAMPIGGPRLPQNLIDLVELWRDDGLLEE